MRTRRHASSALSPGCEVESQARSGRAWPASFAGRSSRRRPGLPLLLGLCALGLVAAGCRERAEPLPPPREKLPPRRVIVPPGTVRPLPPYAISNDGVGPYLLGATLANVLYELPSGPRMALLDVPGLIKQNVIRAEDDGVLVSGAVLGDATVIAVVSREVARTDSGIAVGSPRSDVERELGSIALARVARDPRLWVPQRMPAARLVMQDDHVEAFLLKAGAAVARPLLPEEGKAAAEGTGAAAGAALAAGPPPPAGTPAKPKSGKDLRDVKPARDAKAGASARCPAPKLSETEDASGRWFAACLSPAGEIVRIREEEVSVRSGADGKERLLTQLRVRGLVFAAPLRAADRAADRPADRPDERDELVVVSRGGRPGEERSWTVALYHLEAGRLVRVAEQVVYRLSAEGARWIGVSLDEVELYLELASREDSVVVSGFLVTKVAGKIRDVVSLREVDVSRRRGGSPGVEAAVTGAAPPVVDAAIDGGVDAPDAAL